MARGPGPAPRRASALAGAGAAARGATVVCTLELLPREAHAAVRRRALVAAGVARRGDRRRGPARARQGPGQGGAARPGSTSPPPTAPTPPRARAERGLPHLGRHGAAGVTLKLATSLDGKLATAEGESHGGSPGRRRARWSPHSAPTDAVEVGLGTAIADDPQLTARDVDGPVHVARCCSTRRRGLPCARPWFLARPSTA